MASEITNPPTLSAIQSERCAGPVRWVGKTLQQLWEIIEYKDSKPWMLREEWRNVPEA